MVRRGGIPWNKSLPWSQEVRDKIADGNRKPCSQEKRAKISATLTGRKGIPHTEEFKQAMSVRLKGKKRISSPAFIAANKVRNLGKKSPKHSVRMQGNTYARGNKGKKQDPEFVRRRITATSKFFEKFPRQETSLEKKLYELLDRAGYSYQKQKRFGSRIVDAYVPELNLAFEADGAYWHKDKQAQIVRDEYLISRGIEAIVHLTDADLLKVGR